jgi:acetyl-CoA carboxylase carboxyl transferase subunit beta
MMEAAYLDAISKNICEISAISRCKASLYFIMYRPYNGGTTASCYVRRYNISEPGALIGFAGPRVVRDTTGKDLQRRFQTVEFVRTRFLRFYYT